MDTSYCLLCVGRKGNRPQELMYSHSKEKLLKSASANGRIDVDSADDTSPRRLSADTSYPRYLIREMPEVSI